MKANIKSIVTAVAVVAIPLSIACTTAITQQHENTQAMTPSIAINFKKGKLIEVAFLSVKPDQQHQLQEQYFKKVMPIAMEYGLKPLGKIRINQAYSEFVKPQIIGFFEWPSQEKHRAFLKDKRFLAIKAVRDNAMSFLRMGYFKVEEDTRVTFDSGKLVEIYAMWLDPQNAHRMQTYFKNVVPLITGKGNKYDVKFPLSLKSVDYGVDTYQPESFGIAIWKSAESNNRFFSSKAYARIKADKDAAIARLDVWHGEIVTN